MRLMKSMKSKVFFCVVLSSVANVATLMYGQDKPKPNIAVTGCLTREGYGGFAVNDAKIDGMGATAMTAAPGAGKPVAQAPVKWVLDHAGPAGGGQHIAEKVQIIGVAEWVEATKGGTQAAPPSDDPGAGAPHIDVVAIKPVSGSCS
jgi:hypothetical protein